MLCAELHQLSILCCSICYVVIGTPTGSIATGLGVVYQVHGFIAVDTRAWHLQVGCFPCLTDRPGSHTAVLKLLEQLCIVCRIGNGSICNGASVISIITSKPEVLLLLLLKVVAGYYSTLADP